jgi:DNA-binding LytR/AlgR family response regulator
VSNPKPTGSLPMSKYSCVIVEDDVISLKVIETMAQKTGVLDIANSFTSPIEAANWLAANHVDIMFLDMEMPDLNGIELLKSLPQKPAVIVISGNPTFAIDAFESSVADYLLKPIKDYSRFLQAVNKVVASLENKAKSAPAPDSIYVKVDSLLQKVCVADILWVEASGDYIKIQTPDKVHVVYSTLKNIEEKLPPELFIRIHRSYIVNVSKIANIDATNLEINKKIFPISASYREELLNRIKVL